MLDNVIQNQYLLYKNVLFQAKITRNMVTLCCIDPYFYCMGNYKKKNVLMYR